MNRSGTSTLCMLSLFALWGKFRFAAEERRNRNEKKETVDHQDDSGVDF